MIEGDIIKLKDEEEGTYPFLAGKECEVVLMCDEKPTDQHVGYVRIVGHAKEYRVELVKFVKV